MMRSQARDGRLGDGVGGKGILDKEDSLSKWPRGETQPTELYMAERQVQHC